LALLKKGEFMPPTSKILSHPDKEEIIRWLKLDGVSVRDVEKRLSQKYPKKSQAHLRVAFSTIQAFKKEHLNLEGKVLEDIKEQSKLTRLWAKRKDEAAELEKTSAYQDVLKKIASQQLDTRQKILNVFGIIESRLETIFDKASSLDFVDKDVETLLLNYLKQLQSVIDQHKKYEEGYREQVDVNINVNVMTEQIQIMRDAVRETLADTDPDLSLRFMANLSEKMKKLTYGSTQASNKHSLVLDSALGNITEVDFE